MFAISLYFGSVVYAQLAVPEEKIALAGKEYTKEEYAVKKGELITAFKNKTLDVISFREWTSVADIEVKKCGEIRIENFKSETVMEEINSRIEKGSC